jgi:hypothetical protein
MTPVTPPPRIRTWKSLGSGSVTWLCCVEAAMFEAIRDDGLEIPARPSGEEGLNIRTIDRSRVREVVRE